MAFYTVKRVPRLPICLVGALFAAAVLGGGGEGDYAMDWYTIDGGGGASAAAEFDLSGTIGQPDAGVMSGGEFTLSGGFRSGDGIVGVPCPADFDGSGAVGFEDLIAVLVAWGPYDPCPPFIPEDIDQDCEVGFSDLLAVLANWGPCPERISERNGETTE